jgi:hypothetical protein
VSPKSAKPRHIVSPIVFAVIIQEDWGKQAELERCARTEPLDDQPGSRIFFVRVGPHGIELKPVSVDFGEELAPTGEGF